jgi:uncharacterized RDD family membrane protein YckC
MTTCQYCQANNFETDPRCLRCGRRLQPANPRPAPEGYVPTDWEPSPGWDAVGSNGTATAAALDALLDRTGFETVEGGRAAKPAADARESGASGVENLAARVDAYQQPLFRDGAGNSNKVVPIPTLAPLRQTREAPRRMPRSVVSQVSRPGRATAAERNARLESQQALFQGEPEAAPTTESICCDVPVAVPIQRMLAVFVDFSLIVVAAGIVLVVFLLGGGDIAFSREAIPPLVGVLVVLALFYRILWVIADGDTPGMRFAGLRLVDFDGRKPHRDARLLRQAAGFLSLCSLGLGLVWALVDEESLTWHDHISKTFPTAG